MKATKQSDWTTNPLPSLHVSIPLDRSFSPAEMERIQRGLMPQQQEDKWFIYWQEDTLYFHRSWTGNCLYVVYFENQDGVARMVRTGINRDPDQYSETNDQHDARLISYLIDVLLLRRPADFPSEDSDDPLRAIQNWGLVGRAMFDEHPESE